MTSPGDLVTAAGAGRVPGPPRRRRHGGVLRVCQAVGGLVIAAVLVGWGLPHFAGTSWARVLATLDRVGTETAVGLMFVMVGGLWLYTFTLTGSLPGLTHPRALILNVCGSSVGNLLPGGGAAGVAATYTVCRSWGFSRRDISTSIIVSGVWNVLARVALPVVGLVVLVVGAGNLPRAVTRGGIAGAVVGLALLGVFVAVLASPRAATRVGRALDRVLHPVWRRSPGRDMSIDELIHDLRRRISAVVRTGWGRMTFGLVGFFGVYYLLFWFCLHAVDVRMPFPYLFAAYALGRLLTAVGITPGGVGVTETGTAAVLIGWGADPAGATAGVVLFSLYTHLMEIPLGAAGWVAWGLSRKQRPTDLAPDETAATGRAAERAPAEAPDTG